MGTLGVALRELGLRAQWMARIMESKGGDYIFGPSSNEMKAPEEQL